MTTTRTHWDRASDHAEHESWEKPAPDGDGFLQKVEPFRQFPVDALPEPVRRFVVELAEATTTDPACCALASMVTLAGTIGNRVAANVKRGWVEPAVLWGGIVQPSGTQKTAAIRLAVRPVIEILKESRAEFEERIAEYEAEQTRFEAEFAQWKADQKRKDAIPTDPPVRPEPPTERRLIVSDCTIEKLGVLLEQNPMGLFLVRDELAAWLGAFDRYSGGGKGSDCPTWLSFHDAQPTVIDRKGSPKSMFIERAAVSVLGGIQPGTLQRVFGAAEREAGLMARLLLVQPPTKPVRWTDAELSEHVAAEWSDLLRRLMGISPAVDDQGNPRPNLLPLAPEAKKLFIPWHDAHGVHIENADTDDLRACLAKLKGQAIRFALLFACIRAATGSNSIAAIDGDDIARAIQIADWFKYEAGRVYSLMAETEDNREQRELVKWIRHKGGSVTANDLAHGPRQFRGTVDDAKARLDELVRAGLGQWHHPPPGVRGGRPSARFQLGPTGTGTETPRGAGRN